MKVDLDRFNYLMGDFQRKELGQDPYEWRCFLEFAAAYFVNRLVQQPLVVEIGIWNGLQRRFYTEFLNAEYIGIDNLKPFAPVTVPGCSVPDIVGDSRNPATVAQLQAKLAGRLVDLLFIDGDHSYQGVRADYELYGPLVRHLVAFHDIFGQNPADVTGLGVYRFWNELVTRERDRPFVIFKRDSTADWVFQMGIGVLLKGG